MKNLFLILSFFLFSSCKKSEQKIISLLRSNDKNKILEGAYYAGESESKHYIPYLLENINDPRISHNTHYYGMSVYQAKINALKKILKKHPPHNVSYEVDTVNINYYRRITKKY